MRGGVDMDTNNLIQLRIKPIGHGVKVMLDEKEIHHVENYSIVQGETPGTARLTLTMLVGFPSQENT